MLWTIFAVWMLVLSIFLTAKFWMWMYKNAFGIQINKKIIFISLFIGWIAAFSILFFPHIASYFHLSSFTDGSFSWKILFTFLIYLNILIIVLFAIFRAFSVKQFLNLLTFNIYFILLFYIFWKFSIEESVLIILFYYLFVAYGEEFVKNQLAFLVNNKIWELESDLLLYHILVAIGFAFWENIVYLMWAIGFETFITTLIWWLSIVVLRWVLGFWAHTFYSSLIWMWNIIWFLSIFVFILISMLVHYSYDLSLYFEYKFIIPIFIIVIYFWISYMFYKIDRIYVN